jgi:hypothetical protein
MKNGIRFLRIKNMKKFFISLIIVLALSINAQAEQKPDSPINELSECGKAIKAFKVELRDFKLCERDADCAMTEGVCPMGCNVYVNKNFVEIAKKRLDVIEDVCSHVGCSSVCPKIAIRPACINNKCKPNSIKYRN